MHRARRGAADDDAEEEADAAAFNAAADACGERLRAAALGVAVAGLSADDAEAAMLMAGSGARAPPDAARAAAASSDSRSAAAAAGRRRGRVVEASPLTCPPPSGHLPRPTSPPASMRAAADERLPAFQVP